MIFFHGLAAWLGLLSTVTFLFLNIKDITQGVGYIYLIISGGCAIFIIAARINHASTLAINKSTLWLLAFLTYFVTKAFIDIDDLSIIKGMTVGTTGGMIFALILGGIVSIFFQYLYTLKKLSFFYSLFILIFQITLVIFALIIFKEHSKFLRPDIFMIENLSDLYQRPGNFIIMLSLISAFMLIHSVIKSNKKKSISLVVLNLNKFIYFILVAILLPTTQIIGSNTGFVVTLGLAFATALWLLVQKFELTPKKIILISQKVKNAFFIKTLTFKILSYIFVVFLIFSLLCLLLLNYFQIETSDLRIFGFENQQIGGNSLISRLTTLERNFMIHFSYNPLFGNLAVDRLTTGVGSYAHSIISMVSHLGIFGSLLFAIYLIQLYREFNFFNYSPNIFDYDFEVNLFKILAIVIIFGFACIGTFFTWMPLWFGLGLLFPPLIVYKSPNRKKSSYKRTYLLYIQSDD